MREEGRESECVCEREREGERGRLEEKKREVGQRKRREGNVIKEELWGNLPSAITLILQTQGPD